MKTIQSEQKVKIPEGVKVSINHRVVTVRGKRGTLTRSFKHTQLEMKKINKDTILVRKWFGLRKQLAGVRTVCSHIENMIVGVSRGFQYKMKAVYAHFPINVSIQNNGARVEIRNFLGEKRLRTVDMRPGVTVQNSPNVKDEIMLQGNDIEIVSQCAALIQQSTTVKNKDIRKFLDGVYVSQKGHVEGED